MPELSRRFFLGGLLSIGACTVVAPKVMASAGLDPWVGTNLPRIFANGRDYDADGLIALMSGREVVFPHDKIAVSDAQDIIIHSGSYIIDREINVESFRRFDIKSGTFDGTPLREPYHAIFSFPSGVFALKDGESVTHFYAENVIHNPNIQFVRKERYANPLAVKVRRNMEVRYDINKVAYWQGNMTYPENSEAMS